MTRMTLTSTTALLLSLAMSPASAQNAAFPCAVAGGGTVDSAEAFADYLIAQRDAGMEPSFDDPAFCGPRAGRQAKRAAGEALSDLRVPRGPGAEAQDDTAEAADAPAEETAEAAPAEEPVEAAPAETADPMAEAEAPVVAADPPTETADSAEATPAPDADPATEPAATETTEDTAAAVDETAEAAAPEETTDAAPAVEETAEPDAAAETEPMVDEPADSQMAAEAEPSEDEQPAATADAPAAEPTAEDTASEAAPAEVEPQATDTAPSDADLAAQLAAQAEADDATAATDGGEPDATTAAPADATPETDEATAAQSGEAPAADAPAANGNRRRADGALPPELTPEQRARREARRAERAAARQASAAAQADAAPAETETEEVTQSDVRDASEDFQSQVLSDTQDVAESSDDEGLSNFEKAILLGLGAATVGALLNNGDEVVSNSGDRLIVEREGELRVLKDDNTLLRQPGVEVQTQTFDDGSSLTTVTREDGSIVRTVRSSDGTVLRRTLVRADGTEVALIDDLDETSAPVDVASLPTVSARNPTTLASSDDAALRNALTAQLLANTERTYSLEQVRGIQEVRDLAPQVELDTVTFASGSAAIQPSEAEELGALGRAIREVIAEDPGAVFLIEGHTDAVGDAAYNLGLSDRRAETVALALTQYFDVPPENLVTQGYGEQYLKIRTPEAERANRRAAVRNVTGLLRNS